MIGRGHMRTSSAMTCVRSVGVVMKLTVDPNMVAELPSCLHRVSDFQTMQFACTRPMGACLVSNQTFESRFAVLRFILLGSVCLSSAHWFVGASHG